MSKAFRNQIATIAALDGFTNLLIDIIRADEKEEVKRYPWDTPIKETLVKIKNSSRLAQMQCKGQITKPDYDMIFKAVQDTTPFFKVPEDNVYSIVSFIAFSLIGIDEVVESLKNVKKKLRNQPKIDSLNNLAAAGFELIKFFDPALDRIHDYEKASLARKVWEQIFLI